MVLIQSLTKKDIHMKKIFLAAILSAVTYNVQADVTTDAIEETAATLIKVAATDIKEEANAPEDITAVEAKEETTAE